MDLLKLVIISAFLLGFLFSYLFDFTIDLSATGIPTNPPDYLSSATLPIAIFILSLLFFGYGSIIAVFLTGFSYGYMLNTSLTTNIIISMTGYSIVTLIAAISAAMLGEGIWHALKNKQDIEQPVKTSVTLLIISVILSILIQYISTAL